MDIKIQIEDVLKEFEGLSYDKRKNELWGNLHLSQEDYYEVKIDLNPFPLRFPRVFEIGERIPCKSDRHKYNNSDECCITTKAKAQILLKTRVKILSSFMGNIMVPYFENNSYYEINGEYLFGEFSHGIIGIFEGYQEILGVKNYPIIVNLMRKKVIGKKIRPNDKCYCGSGEKIKRCSGKRHAIKYRFFRLISSEVLKEDLDYFHEVVSKMSD